ncbi:MAG TPA: carbon-nitrogen hydrolase family protein [bacterium]|nr:carbon-nitrogen hydrolase family protein [bacterium]
MTMRLALVQCPCGDLPIYDNLLRVRRHLAAVAKAGAQLVIFPELTNAPYFPVLPGNGRAHIEPVPGPYINNVAAMAREFKLAVLVSVAERQPKGKPYLTAVLIDARGRIAGSYRKVHLPGTAAAGEKKLFRPGTHFPVMRCGGVKLGVLLCYDRHFPEAARALALAGAALIIIPAASPVGAAGSWLFELAALAFTNGCYVAAVNRSGCEGALQFLGESCLLAPTGEVLARAGADEETLLFDIDPAVAAASLARRCYFPDRAPAAYAARRGRRVR